MKRGFYFLFLCTPNSLFDAFFQFFDVKRQGPVRREWAPLFTGAGGIKEKFILFYFLS